MSIEHPAVVEFAKQINIHNSMFLEHTDTDDLASRYTFIYMQATVIIHIQGVSKVLEI